MHIRRLIAALIVLLATTTAARAENLARAKKLFKAAEVKFGLGEFAAALKLYQDAFAAAPRPGFHYNIAQCHRNLDNCEKAIFHFKQYLALDKRRSHAADAETLIKKCEAKIADDRAKAKAKADAAAAAAAADAAKKKADADAAKRAADAAKKKKKQADGDDDSGGRKRLHPAFFWTGVAVTGALALIGTITGALALDKSSEYRSDSTTDPQRLRDLKDSGESLRSASTGLFVTAGITAAATAAVFFFTRWGSSASPKEKASSRWPSFSASVTPVGAAVGLSGRF